MTDHKFEPFQQVLVRSSDSSTWVASHFSHIERGLGSKIICTSGLPWNQCIPYTDETAHLLGTTQPYEPPKPPVAECQRFKCGEWVEVLYLHTWVKALFLFYNGVVHCAHVPVSNRPADSFEPDKIRIPLPDSATK